jgi:hypothetical protein
MSLSPGATIIKDPQAELVYTWDWTSWLISPATVTTSTFTITGPDAALASDNESIPAGGLTTKHRLTGGTLGRSYTVTNRVITNESPAQTEDSSITVVIRQK